MSLAKTARKHKSHTGSNTLQWIVNFRKQANELRCLRMSLLRSHFLLSADRHPDKCLHADRSYAFGHFCLRFSMRSSFLQCCLRLFKSRRCCCPSLSIDALIFCFTIRRTFPHAGFATILETRKRLYHPREVRVEFHGIFSRLLMLFTFFGAKCVAISHSGINRGPKTEYLVKNVCAREDFVTWEI